MTQEQYQQLAHKLPADPGIYKYYDAKGVLIYVGKAKCLKKESLLILQKIKAVLRPSSWFKKLIVLNLPLLTRSRMHYY